LLSVTIASPSIEGAGWQCRDRCGSKRKAAGKIIAVPGNQPHAGAIAPGHDPCKPQIGLPLSNLPTFLTSIG
jgi:hypothetical protein